MGVEFMGKCEARRRGGRGIKTKEWRVTQQFHAFHDFFYHNRPKF